MVSGLASGAAGDQRNQPLELRIPALLIVLFSVPATFFWGLAAWVVGEGGGFNVFVVVALMFSAWLVMLARAGTTLDPEGIRTSGLSGRSRRLSWAEVDDFHRNKGISDEIYVRTLSGELVQVIGLPSRKYRRQHYRSSAGLVEQLVADLRRRLRDHTTS